MGLALPNASSQAGESPAAPTNHRADNGTVVHFGDSFVNAGLQQTLRPKFRAHNTRYIAKGQTNAFLSTFAFGPELDNLYWSYRPALFVVTLGANDLLFSPAHKRSYQVREIVRRMRGTPCVWISIPLWPNAPDEFVEMTREQCGPCRHFDSSTLATSISRQSDGRHPDSVGGAAWAEAFWDWLQKERDATGSYWKLKDAPTEEHAPRVARSNVEGPDP